MRMGWQNQRSAPIGMGMVNCNYRVYTPLGWSNRMNWTDIIRPTESGPKGTSSRFSGTKNASLSGMRTGSLYVMTICWKFVKLTNSIYVICSSSTFHR
jgi:hypothetical protein